MIRVNIYTNSPKCASVEFHCPVEGMARLDYFEFQDEPAAIAFANLLALSEQNKGDLVEIVRH